MSKITIINNMTLNLGTSMNRRRPFSWGKGRPQTVEFQKMVAWDSVLDESIEWTHMLTINQDPKTPNFVNDPKILKSILKSFFKTHSRLFSHIALVIEEGHGKYHAHALIKTHRSPTLNQLLVKRFSKNQNLDTQKAIVFQKINDHRNQNCEYRWIGYQMMEFPHKDFPNTGGYPYLRKEKQNRMYCYLFK